MGERGMGADGSAGAGIRVQAGGLCLPTLGAKEWSSLPGWIGVGCAPPISCWGGVVLEARLGMCFPRSENTDLGHAFSCGNSHAALGPPSASYRRPRSPKARDRGHPSTRGNPSYAVTVTDLLNICLMPRMACLVRSSFSIKEKRTWVSP